MTVLYSEGTSSDDSYQEIELAPSAPRAASGDGNAAERLGAATTLRVLLDVTAFTVAGGNTLDVVIEDSIDGANWQTIATFAQKLAVGREVVNVSTPFARRVRARWTVGAAANPTFRVLAAAR